MSNDPEYDAKIREFSRALNAGELDEDLVSKMAASKTDEEKLAFIKGNGWTESCLYDDLFNPPDPSFYRDGQLVFNLNESFRLMALANLRKKTQ